ncbi:hypothetical protein EJ06DRAFT_362364 [Trichodelitschia bisporula]|uniref:Uncharacterized protein n=1 Tax=Trichodelitschia bisporula TaxID=703511 RepID=A0A6G1I172_9PEZI|nr:hypothetical protein EJ06DRAFT_362364 [Trichodelitschia bisporula]
MLPKGSARGVWATSSRWGMQCRAARESAYVCACLAIKIASLGSLLGAFWRIRRLDA